MHSDQNSMYSRNNAVRAMYMLQKKVLRSEKSIRPPVRWKKRVSRTVDVKMSQCSAGWHCLNWSSSLIGWRRWVTMSLPAMMKSMCDIISPAQISRRSR